MIQKPFRGTQLNRMHPLAKGLVGCWLFNEATGETVFDSSGNGNSGTLENGVAWGADGLEFDGVDDYIDCGDIDIDGNGTITSWVYPTSTDGNRMIIAKSGSGGLAKWLDLSLYIDDGILMAYIGDGTNSQNANSGLSISNNVWQFVSVSVDGTNVNFRVDDNSNSVGQTHIPTGNIHKYSIGRLGESNYWYFNGTIDSVRIYNRALSVEEIAWSYREPYAMFEPAFNPALLYSAAPPVGAIMNQFQRANIGADLYNGAIVA